MTINHTTDHRILQFWKLICKICSRHDIIEIFLKCIVRHIYKYISFHGERVLTEISIVDFC
jgi:hypothetical protein